MKKQLILLIALFWATNITVHGEVLYQEGNFKTTHLFATISSTGEAPPIWKEPGNSSHNTISGRAFQPEQFDPNLGDLIAVNISYFFWSSHRFTFENNSVDESLVEARVRSRVRPVLEASAGEEATVYFSWYDYPVEEFYLTESVILAPGESFSIDRELMLDFNINYTTPSELLAFIGDSTFFVGMEAESGFTIMSLDGPPTIRTTREATIIGGDIVVEFVYHAIPEPYVSALLIGAGTFAFAFARHRLRKT